MYWSQEGPPNRYKTISNCVNDQGTVSDWEMKQFYHFYKLLPIVDSEMYNPCSCQVYVHKDDGQSKILGQDTPW